MAELNQTDQNSSHDQNFKNLILDYPRPALEFFAGPEAMHITPSTRITPIRQEQLKDRLGDRFRELDIPLLVEWPDGSRGTLLFAIEEESDPARFSIHRLGHYCLDLSRLFDTNRVVPVVIFLRPGRYPTELQLGGDWEEYLSFRFIVCDLGRMPATAHLNSRNIVARLNLPNMAHDRDHRLDIYSSAQEGLVELEGDIEKQLKYAQFIDMYADLTDDEQFRYQAEYMSKSPQKEALMGLHQKLHEDGVRIGKEMGKQEGRQEGRQEGESIMLQRLLNRIFGPLPGWAEHRLETASKADLEAWADRIPEARTVEAVFGVDKAP